MTALVAQHEPVTAAVRPTAGLARKLLTGTSALGAATAMERGMGFLASLLAARLGGASSFGAYSLALTTANNIAAYTGSGIGNTATRFAGEHHRRSPQYRSVARALILVTAASSLLAVLLMLAAAGPMARYILRNPGLETLLQCSAISAAAMISLECCRGFLIGQRRYAALLLLSVLAGAGLLFALPIASRSGAQVMVLAQGTVVLGAVLACVALAGPLHLRPLVAGTQETALRPVLRQIWSFGAVQLASLLSLNIAGWWMTSLIARADASLVQIGLFAISNQIRNMVALLPGMLTQSSYALMIDGDAHPAPAVERVTALCTLAANVVSVLLAGACILVLPWVLPAVYGATYAAAVLPASLALATAVTHMGSAALASRLTIVDVRTSGLINVIWAVLVSAAATMFVRQGGAVQGAAIFLAAHLLSAWLTVVAIGRAPLVRTGGRPGVPHGVSGTLAVGQIAAGVLLALAFLRQWRPEWQWVLTGVMAQVLALSVVVFTFLGRHYGWVPKGISPRSLLHVLRSGRT